MARRERYSSRFKNRVVSLRRVSRMQAGGRRLSFSVMIVIGDNKGTVGIAMAKGASPKEAIEKGIRQAEKKLYTIELIGDTIPHEIETKFGAARILMRPARPGTGVIAGTPSRALLELAGVRNVYAKQLGTGNTISNVYCTLKGLRAMRKGRVLSRMGKMQDRVKLKKELDKKEQDMEKRIAERRKSENKDRSSGGRRRRGYQRPRKSNVKVKKSGGDTVGEKKVDSAKKQEPKLKEGEKSKPDNKKPVASVKKQEPKPKEGEKSKLDNKKPVVKVVKKKSETKKK